MLIPSAAAKKALATEQQYSHALSLSADCVKIFIPAIKRVAFLMKISLSKLKGQPVLIHLLLCHDCTPCSDSRGRCHSARAQLASWTASRAAKRASLMTRSPRNQRPPEVATAAARPASAQVVPPRTSLAAAPD